MCFPYSANGTKNTQQRICTLFELICFSRLKIAANKQFLYDFKGALVSECNIYLKFQNTVRSMLNLRT